MIKRFLEWLELKVKLNDLESEPPIVHERELWWISFGENIGSEIDGKSQLFSRPGLILKKLSRSFYLVAPTTSQIKTGSWYSTIKHKGKEMSVCLHQVRTVDCRRLSSLMGQVDEKDFTVIKESFFKLYR